MVLDGFILGTGRQHRFKPRTLKPFFDVFVDIKHDHLKPPLTRSDLLKACPFLFEVKPLLFTQMSGDLLKASVKPFFVIDPLIDQPPLIEQRQYRFVLHRLIDSIAVYLSAKLRKGVLLSSHQRCPGEAEVARFGEDFFHRLVQITILRTVRLIDKYEGIGVIKGDIFIFDFFKFMDECSDDRFARLQQAYQVFARSCSYSLDLRTVKCLMYLFVKVFSVCYYNDLGACDATLDHLGEHHHRQRLTRPLRMPDEPSLPSACGIQFADAFHDLLDGKILLIPGDLFDLAVKDDKGVQQLHHALFIEKSIDSFV